MQELKHSEMKKLEIVVQGEYQDFVLDLLERAAVSGYTILHNLSGKGSHGSHEGHLMFNEDDVLVMIITNTSSSLNIKWPSWLPWLPLPDKLCNMV